MTPSPFWPQGLSWTLERPRQSVFANLRDAATRTPERTALVFYGAELSYAELLARVERLAAFLQHRCEVKAGDRVLLDMQNSPQFIIAYYAILRADAVVVPVNPMNLTEEIFYFAQDSAASVALIGSELQERFAPLSGALLAHVVVARYADEVPAERAFRLPPVVADSEGATIADGFVAWEMALAEIEPPLPHRAGADDLCVMPYTSGTTGKPKACMHIHDGVNHTAFGQAVWYGYDQPGTVLSAFMPLFHVAGMQASMNGGIAAGVTMVVMARWDRDLVPLLFEKYGVTFWSAAPTMIVDVLASQNFADRACRSLRVLTGGGASMPAAVAEQLLSRFGLRFCEGYGLSETISATHINPVDRPKPQCLGIPFFETTSRIVDPETLTDLPAGEIGEIVIAGPQIMRGYWRRPEADKDVFFERDGLKFLRTGDLGYVDEEGYFFIVDRLKRMVSVSGFKVWPAECEAILYRHPAVQECCVIAAPDAYRGETVKAFVVKRPEADPAFDGESLMAWARTVMAPYKAPRLVEFVDALPRSGSSKIDWRRLQEAEWAKG
jgi:fatty-acyl-CoA synthase